MVRDRPAGRDVSGLPRGITPGMGGDRLHQRVDGRVVLVTGASSGIGAASARQLAAAGATVALVARSADRLETVAAGIRERGGEASVHPADLADLDAVEALVGDVLGRHGSVDVLVNNAGHSIRRSIELSYDRFHDYERTLDVNYRGPVRLVLALLPGMRERGWGRIVNVSSAGVLIPAPRFSAYLASKSAFDAFLRSIAGEVYADGVVVSSLYMPLVLTPMVEATRIYTMLPGLSPDQAGAWVCRALADDRRTMAPWYGRAGAILGAVFGRPPDRLLSFVYRAGRDSAAARGESDVGSDAALESPVLDTARRLVLGKGTSR
jgi:NAD(P)-dependent dehydrogenase (short-subunit alcohol dehydrogenase family)